MTQDYSTQDYSNEVQVIREAVERDEHEFQRAFDDLKGAVSRPFEVVERLAATPLPWIFGALLIGFWLGSRRVPAHDRGASQ